MQKTFMLKEVVAHYHTITLDEELDIDEVVNWAKANNKLYDTGYEAVNALLSKYKEKYGFDFEVKANDCGTEVLDMDIVEEM